LIYFYSNKKKQARIMDGNKILILCATLLRSLLTQAELGNHISIAAVQPPTNDQAIARFLSNNLNVNTETGEFKDLASLAGKSDILIYFEANGRGNVIFGPNAVDQAQKASNNANSTVARACKILLALNSLVKPFNCDALVNLLLVEVCLFQLNFTLEDWDEIFK